MLKILSSLFLLLSLPCYAAEFSCVNGEFSQADLGVETRHKASYCYTADKAAIVSRNCRKQNCSAYRVGKRYYAKELLTPIGSPGFRLCRELGAEPEILSFLAEGKFYETDRCIFPDGAFVSTDLLMDFYLDRGDEEDAPMPGK